MRRALLRGVSCCEKPGCWSTRVMAFSDQPNMATNAYESAGLETAGTELEGPFVEPPAQGGRMYYRCPDCGREVLADDAEHLSHAPGCANQ